ncbi:MAG: phenylacetic acid degradation operon negative regulatory protein [Pseudonocardiales bacterium]|jgi:phenylacetic acid degradation operon negative regulatory protein|nr:phenylacetic acid degradation operon negative regulatory protein [Pseudonocardiales bacterium]
MSDGASQLALDPVPPTMSRRHAAGSESARGLLFTVLGEFVLPHGGTAWTSALIDVLGRLEIEEKAARQALMRTAADGWLSAERIGRRTRWRLTDNAERLLTEGAERIYGFTGTAPRWDGRWLLVMARVPETDRPARHLLRTRLAWAGFGSPAPGLWISTHTDRVDEVERVLEAAGVLADARIFRAEHVGGGESATMVGQAWDLAAIEQSYRDFLDEFESPNSADPLTRQIDLVHSWRRFPWIDPALPRELLPARWSGRKAGQLFARRHARWSTEATARWLGLNNLNLG